MDISERLTWQQIRERYPDQWVVLVEHDWDEHDLSRYTTARVLACGASRAEVARARPALDAYDCYGCRYRHDSRPDVSAQTVRTRTMKVFPFERSGDLMTVTTTISPPSRARGVDGPFS
jgi:hypothetical protein